MIVKDIVEVSKGHTLLSVVTSTVIISPSFAAVGIELFEVT